MSAPAKPGQREIVSHSAGVVVVRETGSGWRFLVLRAYSQWDFPKGLVEPGEEPLATAIRETREESGITDLEFLWGTPYQDTQIYGHGKVARYYIACTQSEQLTLPVSPELGHPEHHEYRWVEHDEARDLLPARLQPILVWAQRIISQTVN